MSGSRALVRPRLLYEPASSPSVSLDVVSPVRKVNPPERALVHLDLNTVSLDNLLSSFRDTQGLGPASARKIIAERERGGPYAHFEDLDKRVAGLTCTRLLRWFSLAFAPVRAPAQPPGSPVDHCAEMLQGLAVTPSGHGTKAAASSSRTARSTLRSSSTDLVVATFNACKLSPRTDKFAKKLRTLERFVDDTHGLAIICLQELYSNAAGHIANHLSAVTGSEWIAVGCGSDANEQIVSYNHVHQSWSTCQATVYDSSRARCIVNTYTEMAGMATRDNGPFVRPPHVCLFEALCRDEKAVSVPPSRVLCVANVHLSQKEPQKEILHLRKLSERMQAACARSLRLGDRKGLLRGDVLYVLAGDFNQHSESPDFDELKRAGYAGIVAPAGHDGQLTVLNDATSIGGNRLDNIFMPREMLEDYVSDAWVYNFGGAGRRLQETRRESSGRRRSESSDHMPVVAALCVGHSDEYIADTACNREAGFTWQCRRPFYVELDSGR